MLKETSNYVAADLDSLNCYIDSIVTTFVCTRQLSCLSSRLPKLMQGKASQPCLINRYGGMGMSTLPQACAEGSVRTPVSQLYGEALEGVSLSHVAPHGVLELLVPHAHPHTALQLIAGQCWGQEVAQLVIPHSTET